MEYIKKLFKRFLLKSEKCICPHYDIRYVIKRILIQTALIEAHCQYNIEVRDIVTKYVSNNVTELNYQSYMNMAHERPTQFIDMCFGWYWYKISTTYKNYGVHYLFDRRFSLKRLINI